MDMNDILILYYSKNDSTKKMARAIARGIESSNVASSSIRTCLLYTSPSPRD